MNRPFIVALREIRAYLQDRSDLAFSLLLPIAIFALMYGAFGGESMFHGTAYVVNEDGDGAYAALLLERLDELDNLDVEVLSRSEADDRLQASGILLAVYIPAGFSAGLDAGEPARLVFKQRGNGGQEGQIVAGMVRSAAEKIARDLQVYRQVAEALQGQNIPPQDIEITVTKFLERESASPIVSIEDNILGGSPDPVKQFLPGVVTMFVMFSITLSARAIVEERRRGTLERLITTRLTAGQLFVGKFLASIFRGFLQAMILFLLAYLVFRLFTPLSFLASVVITLVFAAAASSLGLVIAALSRTEDQATWIAVFFTMIMAVLGGTFTDVPAAIGRMSINTYANEAFKTVIVRGGSLMDLGGELGLLAGIAVAGLIISRIFFRVIPGGK